MMHSSSSVFSFVFLKLCVCVCVVFSLVIFLKLRVHREFTAPPAVVEQRQLHSDRLSQQEGLFLETHAFFFEYFLIISSVGMLNEHCSYLILRYKSSTPTPNFKELSSSIFQSLSVSCQASVTPDQIFTFSIYKGHSSYSSQPGIDEYPLPATRPKHF